MRLLVALGIVMTLAFGSMQAPAPTYVASAEDAARWVRSSAVRTPDGLVWPSDPSDPKSIDRGLYSGSPGVILFLLELHHVTGKPEYLADARAGADDLLSQLRIEKQSGLYSGVAGLGFTLAEVYRATREEKYRAGVAASIELLNQRAVRSGSGVEWGPVTDIIAGSAGTGLFLLHAGQATGNPAAIKLAISAADRLIELGVAERGGLRWAMDPTFPRLMPNFSHGTAGIAYFLARVYEETRDKKYLDAALAGARYLQAIARVDGDMCLIGHHQPDGMELYYLGWCHGPVGTARLWHLLARVTGDEQWLAWVDKSANGILKSGIPERQTDGFWNNVSQCCGSAGVAQFFLDLHRIKPNPMYLTFSKKVTANLLSRATRDEKGLRWVQAENRTQPALLKAQTGYMQGAAGIGMWLLKLDAAERGRESFVRFPDTPF
jgi:lantibiotic modifying enzyme